MSGGAVAGARESRPGANGAAFQSIHRDEDDVPSVSLTPGEALRVVANAPVLITVTKRPDGHVTRRTHMSLAAAGRTQDRALERGADCVLVVCRLDVVDLLLGAGEAVGRVYGERAGVARGVELGRAEAFAEVDQAEEAWRAEVNAGVAARAGEPSFVELQRRRGVGA